MSYLWNLKEKSVLTDSPAETSHHDTNRPKLSVNRPLPERPTTTQSLHSTRRRRPTKLLFGNNRTASNSVGVMEESSTSGFQNDHPPSSSSILSSSLPNGKFANKNLVNDLAGNHWRNELDLDNDLKAAATIRNSNRVAKKRNVSFAGRSPNANPSKHTV